MDISEIKDRKSLEAWLQGRNREDAIAIAARAALRVLPVFWVWSLSDLARPSNIALPVLRSALTSAVVAVSPTPQIRNVTTKILDVVRDEYRALSVDAPRPTRGTAAAIDAGGAVFTVLIAADSHSGGIEYPRRGVSAVGSAASAAAIIAADAEDLFWAGERRDCLVLEARDDVFASPLWDDENPFLQMWEDVQAQVAQVGRDASMWLFWLDWYAAMLDPISNPPDWALYEQVALIEDEIWKDGPEAIAKRIAEIEAARQPKANPAERLAAQRLLHAALSDFSFDQAARLMRMVPFAEDVKFIRDPEKLARYLGDAEELRDDIETFSAALKAEGAAMQGAGYVATYLDRLLEEFSKTRQTEALNVGKIVKLGKTLDAARLDEVTCREFGTMRMGALAEIVDQLSDMTRQHFSETLLRFAPLEELELEAETSAWEYLNEMRQALEGFKVGQGGIPLHEGDLAVLRDLADDAERAMRGLDSASGPAKSSFLKEVNYRLALLTVTVALGKTRVKEITGPAFKGVDEILKGMKRAKGLSELWELLQKIWE